MIRDTGLVFLRAIRPTLHKPTVIIIGMLQPLLYLLLFGPLLHRLSTGDGNSWQWFVPGIMVQLALFGTSYAGFNLLPEIRSGAWERQQVTPLNRTALLLGRVLREVVLLLIQSLLLALTALIFGFRVGIVALILGLILLAILGLAIGSASYALAMKLRQEYAFAPFLAMTTLPAMLLSGVLLPMNLAPKWLYVVSRINPLTHVVDAERALMAGQWNAVSIWLGPLLAVALAITCITWGTHTFRQDNT